jgi:hypothetical protein
MSFKAGNHLRFAEALVAISIYAKAFAADAQVALDIASTSGSATPSLNLRMPAMPGRTPPLASPAPSLGPFEEEARSLENRRIEFSQRSIIFYGSSSIRLLKTLSQDLSGTRGIFIIKALDDVRRVGCSGFTAACERSVKCCFKPHAALRRLGSLDCASTCVEICSQSSRRGFRPNRSRG